MEITKNQIVDVINLMMTRLDSLENEQTKQKEYIAQIKKRMLELNDFINDIIDIVEDENYDDSESIAKTMEIMLKLLLKNQRKLKLHHSSTIISPRKISAKLIIWHET